MPKTFIMKELMEKKFSFSVWFKNLTSATVVDANIQMTSYYANGCMLVMPAKTCVKGHQVLLRFKFNGKSIEVTGNVVDLVTIDERMNEVNVQFTQYIKEEWQAVNEQFEKKQEEITALLQKLKNINE